MANEKVLNTRIQLKYDTLENWQKSAFNGTDVNKYLKAGEVAVVTLAPNVETNPTHTADQHPLLFKVGTGNHKFDALPWASALAADVYAWAKQSENDFVNTFLALKMTDGTTMQAKLDAVFATDAELSGAIAELRKEIPTQLGVMSVEGKDAIKAEGDANVTISLILDNSGNVALSQGENGLKAEIDLKDYAKKDELHTPTTVAQGEGITVSGEGRNYIISHTVPTGAAVGAKDGITTDKFGHVTAIDLSAKANVADLGDLATKDNITASLVTDFATEVAKVEVAEATHAKAAGKVDNALTVKVGGEEVVFDGFTTRTADVDAAIAAGVAEAKKHADDNDANTEYHIVYDKTNKKIKLVAEAGATAQDMEIPTDDFIKDGMIQTVELVQENDKGEKGQFLKLTWNDDGNDVTYISVGELVDVYAGINSETVNVVVSNKNEISASVHDIKDAHIATDAAIAKSKLAADVQASLAKADSALQAHQDISGKKDVQTPVADHDLSGATVVKGIAQNANGEITVSTRDLTPADIGAQPAGAYKTKQIAVDDKLNTDYPGQIINHLTQNENGEIDYTVETLNVSHIAGLLIGENESTSVQSRLKFIGADGANVKFKLAAGTDYAEVSIADKGVTTAKIADHAIGAHQTKACADYKNEDGSIPADAEIWVFNCGNAEI